MRNAFLQLLGKVKDISDSNFNTDDIPLLQTTQKQCTITLDMLIKIFDQKQGIKVSDMLEKLPQQNRFVLDAMVNLYDNFGEEKALTYEQIQRETIEYCKTNGLDKIDQQQLLHSLNELEYYNFIEDPKKSVKLQVQKDVKKRTFVLKVDLDELITCLDKQQKPTKPIEENEVEVPDNINEKKEIGDMQG